MQACCKAVSAAVVNTTEVIHAEVKQAPELHADETGFGRCGKDRMWLWVAATGDAEVFRLLPGRGRDQAKDLLGDDYSGLIHRDRWKPYEVFKNASHQLCHSHIRRDFQSMLESMGETGTQGCMLKMASDRAFHLWHRFERGEISRKQLIRLTKPIQDEIWQRLEILRDWPGTTKKARGTAKDPLRQWGSLWTYVHRPGALPSNNQRRKKYSKGSALAEGLPRRWQRRRLPLCGAHAHDRWHGPKARHRPARLAHPGPPSQDRKGPSSCIPGMTPRLLLPFNGRSTVTMSRWIVSGKGRAQRTLCPETTTAEMEGPERLHFSFGNQIWGKTRVLKNGKRA